MDIIWSNIAANNSEIFLYDFEYDCNIFCTIKKRKVKIYKLEYKNNQITLTSLNKKNIYNLTYIQDRSNNEIYYFECKHIGGNQDMSITIYIQPTSSYFTCEFKDLKPKLITNYVYNSYTRKYTNSVYEHYTKYRPCYIINNYINCPINPPPYQLS